MSYMYAKPLFLVNSFLPFVVHIQSPTSEGWGGEGGVREVQDRGGICIPMADSC